MMLMLKWIAKDFAAVTMMCEWVSSDTPPTAEEKQLWAIFSDLDDDVDPASHAVIAEIDQRDQSPRLFGERDLMRRDARRSQVRLRLWLAMRACAELECPWQPAEQLQLYLAKLPHIPADCQVSEMRVRSACGSGLGRIARAARRSCLLSTSSTC